MLPASAHLNVNSSEQGTAMQRQAHVEEQTMKFHKWNEHKHAYTHTHSFLSRLMPKKADLALDSS